VDLVVSSCGQKQLWHCRYSTPCVVALEAEGHRRGRRWKVTGGGGGGRSQEGEEGGWAVCEARPIIGNE